MKIFIGADHRGYKLKTKIIKVLQNTGHNVIDVGIHKEGVICDYPKIAEETARAVSRSRDARGILVCLTGIGHVIAANKVPGAYAALCYNQRAARLSRQHNNANILVLGAKFIKADLIPKLVLLWLKTEFEGGRHSRRVRQIKKIERDFCKGSQGTSF